MENVEVARNRHRSNTEAQSSVWPVMYNTLWKQSRGPNEMFTQAALLTALH